MRAPSPAAHGKVVPIIERNAGKWLVYAISVCGCERPLRCIGSPLQGTAAIPRSDQLSNKEIFMTQKTFLTDAQLKDLILSRLGFAAFLTIHRNDSLGFTAGVIAAPNIAYAAQQAVDRIVEELRAHYELKPAKPERMEIQLKKEIVAKAHEHPDGRYLTVNDIAITRPPDGSWSAGFVHDGPSITPACVFEALTFVQNKYDLAD
jgi:hypothetical protein